MCVWWIFHLLMSKAHVHTSSCIATFGRTAQATEDFGHKASRGLCKMYENTARRIAKCASKGEGPQGQALLFRQGVSIAAEGWRRPLSEMPPDSVGAKTSCTCSGVNRCESWQDSNPRHWHLGHFDAVFSPPPPSFPTYNCTKVWIKPIPVVTFTE